MKLSKKLSKKLIAPFIAAGIVLACTGDDPAQTTDDECEGGDNGSLCSEGWCCAGACQEVLACEPDPVEGPVHIAVPSSTWDDATNELTISVDLTADEAINFKWLSVLVELPNGEEQLARFRAESFSSPDDSASGAEVTLVSHNATTFVGDAEILDGNQSLGTMLAKGQHTFEMIYKLPSGKGMKIKLTPHCVKLGTGVNSGTEVTVGHGPAVIVDVPEPTLTTTSSTPTSAPVAWVPETGTRTPMASIDFSGVVGTTCTGFRGGKTGRRGQRVVGQRSMAWTSRSVETSVLPAISRNRR